MIVVIREAERSSGVRQKSETSFQRKPVMPRLGSDC